MFDDAPATSFHLGENFVITNSLTKTYGLSGLRCGWILADQKFAERLTKAGADSTVSPNQIGGMRIASEVLRPHVVNFLDLMLKDKSRSLRIEEIEVPEHSTWINKPLADLHLRGSYNLLTLALKDAYHDGKQHGFWVNPPENVTCHPGLVLIVLGDTKDVQNARQHATQGARYAAR